MFSVFAPKGKELASLQLTCLELYFPRKSLIVFRLDGIKSGNIISETFFCILSGKGTYYSDRAIVSRINDRLDHSLLVNSRAKREDFVF